MVERFHGNSLSFPLARLNKQIHDGAAQPFSFELYGELVGARRLFSLLMVSSKGSLTVIPRAAARDMFYALNALSTTLDHTGLPFRPDWADWRMRDFDKNIQEHGTA